MVAFDHAASKRVFQYYDTYFEVFARAGSVSIQRLSVL